MSCVDCENHDRWVRDAEQAIIDAQQTIKNKLAMMNFNQVKEFDEQTRPLKSRLTAARTSRTKHRNKCQEAG